MGVVQNQQGADHGCSHGQGQQRADDADEEHDHKRTGQKDQPDSQATHPRMLGKRQVLKRTITILKQRRYSRNHSPAARLATSACPAPHSSAHTNGDQTASALGTLTPYRLLKRASSVSRTVAKIVPGLPKDGIAHGWL